MEHNKWGDSVSSKMGRPKVNNPKNIDVKVRFDEATHEKMLKYCDKNNLTKTEMIRKGVDLLLDKK